MDAAIFLVFVTPALYHLGARAKLTAWIHQRYPAWVADVMNCPACSGTWYGMGVAALALDYGHTVFGTTAWWAIPLAGLGAMIWTPIMADLQESAIIRLTAPIGTVEPAAEAPVAAASAPADAAPPAPSAPPTPPGAKPAIPDEAVKLIEALTTIGCHAVANLHPEVIRDVPAEALRAAADRLPNFHPEKVRAEEIAYVWLTHAYLADEWRERRGKLGNRAVDPAPPATPFPVEIAAGYTRRMTGNAGIFDGPVGTDEDGQPVPLPTTPAPAAPPADPTPKKKRRTK